MKKVLIFHRIRIFNRVSQISRENQNPRSQLFAKTVVNDVKKDRNGYIIKKGKIISKIDKEDIVSTIDINMFRVFHF